MAHLIEDMRVLLQAAREIHAERHGAQTFTSGTYLPLEEAGRRSGLNPNREQKGRGVEQPRPSFLPLFTLLPRREILGSLVSWTCNLMQRRPPQGRNVYICGQTLNPTSCGAA
jgi:hypothetical protein